MYAIAGWCGLVVAENMSRTRTDVLVVAQRGEHAVEAVAAVGSLAVASGYALSQPMEVMHQGISLDPHKLPHFPVGGHWAHRDACLSHSHYVTVDNWIDKCLSDTVRTRYALIGRH